MDGEPRSLGTRLIAVAVPITALLLTGCAGFLGNLGYWAGGAMIPAAYGGLEEQRVAVVCVSDGSSYGAGTEGRMLARYVADLLEEQVLDIEVVPSPEIADWIDKNDWDAVDYREVGRGVKADRVVAIDLAGFSLHHDQVLYKARADITVTVFDMTADGKEVFRRQHPDITYPTTGYYQTTETSESTFRQVFLRRLARQVARYFFAYDKLGETSLDPATASGISAGEPG